MPTPPRKTGRPKKDKSALQVGERMLAKVDAAVSAQRRRISAQDRLWLEKYRETDFLEAEKAAVEAGFVTPGMGEKLAARLSNLVEAEKMRASLSSQMEADEALRLLGGLARNCGDAKVQHSALVTVLRVHGLLGDKRVEAEDRRRLAAEVGDLVEQLKRTPGARARLIALEVAVASADEREAAQGDGPRVASADSPDSPSDPASATASDPVSDLALAPGSPL